MSPRRDDDTPRHGGQGADIRARPRIEPRQGWLDGIRFRDPPRTVDSAGLPPVFWWVLAAFLVLALAIFQFRQPLADWLWPETRAQVLREQAALALSKGHLSAADGSGARELYEAAVALDPDRNEAREGLMRVADAALRQAGAAIAQHRYPDAHQAMQLARDLSAPRAQTEAMAALLQQREAEHAGVDQLLANALAAHRTGRLDDGADSALPLYQRVLALQPARTEALEGREDALTDLLQQLQPLLAKGELAKAARIVEQARDYDAGHVGLPEARARIASAVEQRRQRADRDLRNGRLDAAFAGYRLLLDIDPEDAAAMAGIERTGNAYADRAERRASDFRFAEAEADLRSARAAMPDSGKVRDAEQHVERARRMKIRAPTMSAGERKNQVGKLLAEAERSAGRGDWLTPPGDSAYDKLRAAQALAPTDPAVKRAAARALPAVRRCYEDELRGNRLRRTQACLEAWQQLAPNDRDARGARTRLAQRWIAVGTERLGAGELVFAQQALSEARALDPNTAGLDEFATRVRTASAADR
ncbi:hypothetical protein IP90_01848 [Luteimonas cucumeris]|uniref:Tetratricopeptide repeat protein n=1 Tax=Luteimonas cucumeris TaxID=985012 RepID=A0A562L528_9GAMM|nr:hypothetical protein [Luteimonas cucumeris]TWI02751.1 hypothetical protein IP90_01848 [Luteimonas cucumeris]